jgi:phenylalanyl-tRNA synthetase beta chain
VTRDFAFVVPAELAADRLLRAVKGADKAAIAEARIFDIFTGESVGAGLKSVAIEVVLQPVEQSFDEAALREISEKIFTAAGKLGATLRG